MSYFNFHGQTIYYERHGHGAPLVMLHGNTASARMFEPLLSLYAERMQVILMDFLGNGRSDRVQCWPPTLWQAQGRQVAALIEHLQLENVALLGTSGGAWAALNAGLLASARIKGIIADSFDGCTLHDGFAEELLAERRAAANDPQARGFYEWCQGADWAEVVAQDTRALVLCARQHLPLFVAPLETLQVPVLLTGTRTDPACRADLEAEYAAICRALPNAQMHLFETGGHPACYSNAESFAELALQFFEA